MRKKLIYVTVVALFFVGLSMYLLTTEDLHEPEFFKNAIRSLGLLISTSIAVGLIVKLFIGGFFEYDILEFIRKEFRNFVSSSTIVSYGIVNIVCRRTETNVFEEIVQELPQKRDKHVRVFVYGVSLSTVLPHYIDEILDLSKDRGFRFRLLMMSPSNPHLNTFGQEIGEENAFPQQIKSQFENLQRMVDRSKKEGAYVQGRVYDTIPLNCIFYCKTQHEEYLYLVVYLNSVPGSSCPVIKFRRDKGKDCTLFDSILKDYEQMWDKSCPIDA